MKVDVFLPGGWRNRYPDDSTHLASARGDADGAEDGARREHRHHVALVDRRAEREPARGTCAYECEPKRAGGGIYYRRCNWPMAVWAGELTVRRLFKTFVLVAYK